MVQYKFTYFGVRSLGEASRLTLHYAGQEFEDRRVTHEEWPAIKPTTPTGKMPILEVDGQPLCESVAIALYLAKKFNLAGKSDWEQAKVLEAVLFFKDAYSDFAPWMYPFIGFKEGDAVNRLIVELQIMPYSLQDKLYPEHAIPARDKFFAIVKKMLQRNNSGFLVGENVTVADFFWADYLFSLRGMKKDLFDGYSELDQFINKVYGLPQLQKYLASRPESKF